VLRKKTSRAERVGGGDGVRLTVAECVRKGGTHPLELVEIPQQTPSSTRLVSGRGSGCVQRTKEGMQETSERRRVEGDLDVRQEHVQRWRECGCVRVDLIGGGRRRRRRRKWAMEGDIRCEREEGSIGSLV
jgi:hypothetical protein